MALGAALVMSAAPLGAPATAQVPGDVLQTPNILFIVTDDQRPGMMGVMPATRRIFKDEGVTYPEGYVTTPLCCPSRTSIFTGQYAHNHGILINATSPRFDHTETIERYLQDTGYQTAIAGKFLNSWRLETDPPYFDRWTIFRSGYNGTLFNVDGQVRSIEEYSTDYVGKQAQSYIDAFEATDAQPWFLQISPGAPHKPFTPAARHNDADVRLWRATKAIREEDRADKPKWVRQRTFKRVKARKIYERQQRTLIAVDEVVDNVFTQLEELGEAENTLAFFISDNGYLHGEHGLIGKRFPYTDSIKVPFFARWPAQIEGGTVDDRFALNIDIVPTVMEAVSMPTEPEPLPVDGISLLGEEEHEFVFTEQWGNANKGLPDWASIRTDEYQFIQYYVTGSGGYPLEREFYNLEMDPWQLESIYGDGIERNNPRNLNYLQAQLRSARGCEGPAECP